jgi:hypothetical protein
MAKLSQKFRVNFSKLLVTIIGFMVSELHPFCRANGGDKTSAWNWLIDSVQKANYQTTATKKKSKASVIATRNKKGVFVTNQSCLTH